MLKLKRVPRHIGIIPDGNRRWAQSRGLLREQGYDFGLEPGKRLFREVLKFGIEEVSFYVFTQENTRRARAQVEAFRAACLAATAWLQQQEVSLLVVGDDTSPLFPPPLKDFTRRRNGSDHQLKVNFLVNYSWKWDLAQALKANGNGHRRDPMSALGSREVSRVDLVIRWGNRSRLSGFLPLQAAYADLYVVDALWPDFEEAHFHQALRWYAAQDVTLGG